MGLGAGVLLSSKKNLRTRWPADIQPYLVTSPRLLLAVFIHSFNKNGYIYSILGKELYARDARRKKRHGSLFSWS